MDSNTQPASGPLVRGFVWSPGMWTAVEPTATEQPTVAPTAGSAAQPLQRQPTTAATDSSPTAVAPIAPTPTMGAQSQTGQPKLEPRLTSSVAANTEAIVPSDRPITPPVARPETADPTPSVLPPIQRQPAAPETSKPTPGETTPTAAPMVTTMTPSPVAPTPLKSSPVTSSLSPLGRVWRRLGGLVTRPQPTALPPQPEPTAVSDAIATAVPTPTTPVSPAPTPTAVQLSEAADGSELVMRQPPRTTSVTSAAEMPGRIQEETLVSTPMAVPTTAVETTATTSAVQRQADALASPTPPLASSATQPAPTLPTLPMTAVPRQ
ncbi:MAG: hypothetical protein HC804_09540, partial [Anaerolineae bacterium]|nr:hypothetical protein [Anaerolineae bacterium]